MRSSGNIEYESEYSVVKRVKLVLNRRGMYTVEASVILPLFIASMIMVISIIPVISTCENIVFSCADELRLDSARSVFAESHILFPASATARVLSENKGISMFVVTSYRTGVTEEDIDDLILTRFTAVFKNSISLIPVNGIKFTGNMASRAFTGSYHKVGDEYDGEKVYVYPSRGERYHKEGCRYLEAHCHKTILTDGVMMKYHACPLCGAKNAHVGQAILVFERSGEAYHLPECRQIEKEKYYTETTKSSAERAGYTPCSVCGG